jgi:hypothetical protein
MRYGREASAPEIRPFQGILLPLLGDRRYGCASERGLEE